MSIRKRRSNRSGRRALRSPGRPPVSRRENRRLFWTAIAAGLTSERAAVVAGVSPPVGVRWFRENGGMPPTILAPSSKPLSARYLSFQEREEIARITRFISQTLFDAADEIREAVRISGELDALQACGVFHDTICGSRPAFSRERDVAVEEVRIR